MKTLPTAEAAASLFDSMCSTSDALGRYLPEEGASFRPIGFSRELKAVVMPYIDGTDLRTLFQQQGWWNCSDNRKSTLEYVARIGKVLAAYHSHFEDRCGKKYSEAWDNLKSRVTAVGGDVELAKNATQSAMVSRDYGDFHLRNIMVSADDKIVLIDPPLEERFSFVHKDLAFFFNGLFTFNIQPRSIVSGSFKVCSFNTIYDVLMENYNSALDRSTSQSDWVLIKAYWLFLLRRRLLAMWTKKEAPSLLYYGIPMLIRYLRLKRDD